LLLWNSLAICCQIGQKKLVAEFLFAVLFPRSSCVIWFSLSWSCSSTVKSVVVESSAVCFFKALWSCYSGLFFSEDLDQSIHLISQSICYQQYGAGQFVEEGRFQDPSCSEHLFFWWHFGNSFLLRPYRLENGGGSLFDSFFLFWSWCNWRSGISWGERFHTSIAASRHHAGFCEKNRPLLRFCWIVAVFSRLSKAKTVERITQCVLSEDKLQLQLLGGVLQQRRQCWTSGVTTRHCKPDFLSRYYFNLHVSLVCLNWWWRTNWAIFAVHAHRFYKASISQKD
jgi:hypothetical protein